MFNKNMRIHKYDQYHEQLRAELKGIRLLAGLSQERLADLLDTKQVFISKYERGERNLDFIEVLKICNACGYNPCDLIQKLNVHVAMPVE